MTKIFVMPQTLFIDGPALVVDMWCHIILRMLAVVTTYFVLNTFVNSKPLCV